MLPDGVECLGGDLSEREKKFVSSIHFAPAADLFTQQLGGVAWRSKPSSYIVATKDRTVQPELQHFVAKRMCANTTEVASSHVPMLSGPDLVTNVHRCRRKSGSRSQDGSVSCLGTESHARAWRHHFPIARGPGTIPRGAASGAALSHKRARPRRRQKVSLGQRRHFHCAQQR
jgi:hypothetical protein